MTARDAVRTAYLPALLAALAQATGDLSLLRDDLRPDPARVADPRGGLTSEQRHAARDLAVEALERFAEQGDRVAPLGAPSDLRRLFDFMVGEPVSDDLARLLHEELGSPSTDERAPRWHARDVAPERPFRVGIVGAGMSGIAAAHRLGQAGVDVAVLEKNAGAGGTWFENRYPGCRVDVPNHLYSYSFRQRYDWPQRFTPQDQLLDYFGATFRDLAPAADIRFGTEVTAAAYREGDGGWDVSTRDAAGGTDIVRVDALVSAVGQLNRPKLPPIPGRERFEGASFHSAQWDGTVDLRGKRVAVIGTGASAIQIIPSIAGEVGELHVYQRTPNWLMPTPDYHADTPPGMQWLLRHVPNYSRWYRLSLFWRLADGVLPAARVDPEWDGNGASISARSDELRALLTGYLESQFGGSPELLPHVVPGYPPLAKRILLDDGVWAATLTRHNVELVTDRIDAITPSGIDAGGHHREVDVIVYATGFHASEFLMPIRVTGRSGVDLHEQWSGDARAYLGLTVPGFPNLFCLYGPNTNLVANGSIIFFSECSVRYVVESVRLLLERGAGSMDCRRDVHDAYNRDVDAANARMAWGASDVNSWYRNASGRVTQNWPFTLLEFWQRTLEPDPDDFEFFGRAMSSRPRRRLDGDDTRATTGARDGEA